MPGRERSRRNQLLSHLLERLLLARERSLDPIADREEYAERTALVEDESLGTGTSGEGSVGTESVVTESVGTGPGTGSVGTGSGRCSVDTGTGGGQLLLNAIAAAVQRARRAYPKLQVEVEADTLAQVTQATDAGADIILLDNMSPAQVKACVELVAGRAMTPSETEAKRVIGLVPQELAVYPDLTAREFLDYVALLKGLGDTTARRRQIDALLETVGAAGFEIGRQRNARTLRRDPHHRAAEDNRARTRTLVRFPAMPPSG